MLTLKTIQDFVQIGISFYSVPTKCIGFCYFIHWSICDMLEVETVEFQQLYFDPHSVFFLFFPSLLDKIYVV